jgi:hypothetical protein
LIERFNFYDVYGNFLPGLTFLALIWLPIGITRQFWPGKEITSAIAVLAFAYIVGHILQTVFQNALPSKGKDSKGRRRYPSDYFLDSDDDRFSNEFRRELEAAVDKLFHIKLNVSTSIPAAQLDQTSKARQDAFRLARNTLLKSDAESYGQQFQGLYALMRGLAAAFWMGSAYTLGWSLFSVLAGWLYWVAVLGWVGLAIAVVIGFALVFGAPNSKMRMILDRGTFASVLVALCASGVQLGSYVGVSRAQLLGFMLIAAASLWSGARCFSAYKHFAEEFARSTWNDFLSYEVKVSTAKQE